MSAHPLHILAKPTGAICNLDCQYCFYLEKEKLYPETRGHDAFRMNDAVLESYVSQYIAHELSANPLAEEITFAWQGGEPTLIGLDFFRKAIELQHRSAPPGVRISNTVQTNGTLLDDAWCAFFREHNFLIGLSIDGPREIHDRYRVNKAGHGTFDAVMRGWNLLKHHGVAYNTLSVVSKLSAGHSDEVYGFLKEHGADGEGLSHMQFIPLVERVGVMERVFAEPPLLNQHPGIAAVTDWSVGAEQYGDFLIRIFDSWVRHDVGRVFVQLFDVQLGIELGVGSALCVFAETCGRAVAMEHNGDLYSCDHFVYPQYKLGNIQTQGITALAESPQQLKFAIDKRDALPGYCQRCEVREHCNGECPKHRFIFTPDGEAGLNYLCAGYKKAFNHMKPYLRSMADLIRNDRAPAEIMEQLNDHTP